MVLIYKLWCGFINHGADLKIMVQVYKLWCGFINHGVDL